MAIQIKGQYKWRLIEGVLSFRFAVSAATKASRCIYVYLWNGPKYIIIYIKIDLISNVSAYNTKIYLDSSVFYACVSGSEFGIVTAVT